MLFCVFGCGMALETFGSIGFGSIDAYFFVDGAGAG